MQLGSFPVLMLGWEKKCHYWLIKKTKSPQTGFSPSAVTFYHHDKRQRDSHCDYHILKSITFLFDHKIGQLWLLVWHADAGHECEHIVLIYRHHSLEGTNKQYLANPIMSLTQKESIHVNVYSRQVMISYPFAFVHDFADVIPDGAHYIIAHILHLEKLLEPGDQQGIVCSFRQKVVHQCLAVQEKRNIRRSHKWQSVSFGKSYFCLE